MAEERRNQLENVQVRILDDEHSPQDYDGEKFLNCVVRIDNFTVSPGIEEIGSPPAIDKLFAQLEKVTLKRKKQAKLANSEK